jgi:thioredoxin 1
MGILRTLFGSDPKPGSPRETSDRTLDQDVMQSELPVLLDFWSPGCLSCQVMDGLLREIGPEYVGRLHIYKLNAAFNPQVTAAFRVRGVPTLVFLNKGKVVDQVVGLVPIATLRQILNRIAPAAPVSSKTLHE